MLNAADRELINRSVLCWLATASSDGKPSVSPKEMFLLDADQILIANIASPNSARNIKQSPEVCVSFLDVFVQKGIQVFGQAETIHRGDERFADLALPLVRLAGDAFPFNSLFCVRPTDAKPILAPRYRLFPDTTEAEQIASAMETYGVRPKR